MYFDYITMINMEAKKCSYVYDIIMITSKTPLPSAYHHHRPRTGLLSEVFLKNLVINESEHRLYYTNLLYSSFVPALFFGTLL